MMKHAKHIAVLVLLVGSACNNGPQPVSRPVRAEDKLPFLVSNADFIGLVTILPPGASQGSPRSADRARIIDVAKGNETAGTEIRITFGAALCQGYAYTAPNQQYLAFLKRRNSDYLPLTDQAMAAIDGKYVLGIWNRSPEPGLVLEGELTKDVMERIRQLGTQQKDKTQ